MAPSTPPPPSRELFAAFTIASAPKRVRSPRCKRMSTAMRLLPLLLVRSGLVVGVGLVAGADLLVCSARARVAGEWRWRGHPRFGLLDGAGLSGGRAERRIDRAERPG